MTGTASFGRWLKLRRLALDFTQSELGQLLGCSAMTIRKIEADERRPSRQVAERLAQHLALPSEERAAFLKAARAERSPARLAAPMPTYDPAPPTCDLPLHTSDSADRTARTHRSLRRHSRILRANPGAA